MLNQAQRALYYDMLDRAHQRRLPMATNAMYQAVLKFATNRGMSQASAEPVARKVAIACAV